VLFLVITLASIMPNQPQCSQVFRSFHRVVSLRLEPSSLARFKNLTTLYVANLVAILPASPPSSRVVQCGLTDLPPGLLHECPSLQDV
jgi:hypothetical protein